MIAVEEDGGDTEDCVNLRVAGGYLYIRGGQLHGTVLPTDPDKLEALGVALIALLKAARALEKTGQVKPKTDEMENLSQQAAAADGQAGPDVD